MLSNWVLDDDGKKTQIISSVWILERSMSRLDIVTLFV